MSTKTALVTYGGTEEAWLELAPAELVARLQLAHYRSRYPRQNQSERKVNGAPAGCRCQVFHAANVKLLLR